MPNHFQQLLGAFQHEWNARPQNPVLEGANLEHDGTRFWWIDDSEGTEIIKWECRNFPGCASLVITTKVELREGLRGRGLGRYFRDLRHRAYKRAGFVGEIATVRSDNAAQNRLMETMNAVRMGTFPSDFGGTYVLWLTNLPQVQPAQQPTNPQPAQPTPVRNPHTGPEFDAFMAQLTPKPPVRRKKTFAHRKDV